MSEIRRFGGHLNPEQFEEGGVIDVLSSAKNKEGITEFDVLAASLSDAENEDDWMQVVAISAHYPLEHAVDIVTLTNPWSPEDPNILQMELRCLPFRGTLGSSDVRLRFNWPVRFSTVEEIPQLLLVVRPIALDQPLSVWMEVEMSPALHEKITRRNER